MVGSAGAAKGGAAEGTADDLVDVLQRGHCGGVRGWGVRVEGEGGGGRGDGEGHVGSEKHVVGLDRGADEEGGKRNNREAEATGEVLVCERLCEGRVEQSISWHF